MKKFPKATDDIKIIFPRLSIISRIPDKAASCICHSRFADPVRPRKSTRHCDRIVYEVERSIGNVNRPIPWPARHGHKTVYN